MKQLTLTIAAVAFSLASFAQTNSGKVTYKETINLAAAMQHVELEGEMAAQLADLLPKEQVIQKELYFSPDASLYADAPRKEEKYKENNGIHIDMRMPEEKAYRDIKTGETLEQKDFMSRKFLVSEKSKTTWKMTGKQKTILNYPCQEAVTTKDSNEISVWFTPAIPVSTGPRGLGGLPGLILEANVDKLLTITATSIEPGTADVKKIVKPTEGKKMTEKQFEAMMQEKAKEMGMEGGHGANITIKTNRR
jgi:GLPGLI family protein